MPSVAHVCPFFRPHVGGVESHVEAVTTELARRGWDVRVLTTRLAETPERETIDGVNVRRVAPTATLWSTPIAPGIAREVAALRPDLAHSHSPPPLASWHAARGARRAGVPLVHTHHCDLELLAPAGGLVVETYRRTLGRATLDAADAVVATTQSYAQTSRDLWSRDVRVVPNCVDAERFHPHVRGDGVRVRHGLGDRTVALFVGRLTHHKGVEHFVRAAEAAAPDMIHLVVGDGPLRARFEDLSRALAPGRVVFAGKVPHEDLPSYYAAADLTVLPSNSRLEAFGIVALESMASGRPVVATDIPGVAEVVEDGATGVVAEPYSPEGLARAIGALAEDAKLRERLGRAAREKVLERFTTRRVVDALEDVYRGVLRRSTESP